MPMPRSPSPHELSPATYCVPSTSRNAGEPLSPEAPTPSRSVTPSSPGRSKSTSRNWSFTALTTFVAPAEVAVCVTTGLTLDARRSDTAADQCDHSTKLVGAAIDRDRIHIRYRLLEADQGDVVLVAVLPLGV